MTRKLVSGAIVALVGCVAFSGAASGMNTTAWEGSPVGKCFASIDAYLDAAYGLDHASDENIGTVPVVFAGSSRRLVWAVDKTSGVNVTRVLLDLGVDGRACALLYAPVSSTVKLARSTVEGLPARITASDSPPPGFRSNRIVYEFDRVRRTYVPTTCFKVPGRGNPRRIDCTRAFSD